MHTPPFRAAAQFDSLGGADPSSTRIAGYRIVRTLGEGSRAIVYLGHADVDVDGEGEAASVAIKMFRSTVTEDSMDAEVACLARASHPHVASLRDLGSAPDGRPVLMLEPLARGSLARLLTLRGAIGCGEVVTILAPILSAVESLHSSGVSHGGLEPRVVLFRESGAPVLACFGAASIVDARATPVQRAATPQIVEDLRGLARLSAAVLDRSGTVGTTLKTWVASAEQSIPYDRFLTEFESRLFDLADPCAVQWQPDPVVTPSVIPARVLGTSVAPRTGRELQLTVLAEAEPSREATWATRVWSVPPLQSIRRSWSVAAARVASFSWRGQLAPKLQHLLLGRRRQLVFGLGLAAATLTIALLVIPAANPQAPVSAPESTDGSDAPGRIPSSETVASDVHVVSDDPVAAFSELVRARDACIRQLSVLCLDAVVQQSSAAFDEDTALILAMTEGRAPLASRQVSDFEAYLVERYGDAAIVSWTTADNETASALLVKGEAGWRVRDYLDG